MNYLISLKKAIIKLKRECMTQSTVQDYRHQHRAWVLLPINPKATAHLSLTRLLFFSAEEIKLEVRV